MNRFPIVLVLLLVLGCSVGPDYHRPNNPAIPSTWTTATPTNAPLSHWWKSFHDPALDSLIDRAAKANHDLRIATARVHEARAQRGQARWDLLPTITGKGSYINARTSKNAQVFPFDKIDTDNYDAHFDANWEIDIFGGRRRRLEAVHAGATAVDEDRRAVLVSVLAEVARAYIELRSLQHRLAIARDNIAAQKSALDLTQARFKGGISSQLDVAQATALLAGTESQLPALEAARKRTLHQLALLLAQPPGALYDEFADSKNLPTTPPEIPAGLPSDLLRRRPDIRAAERQLAALTARIGVQTAELFPKFSLVGTAGFQSLSFGDWFTGGSRYWAAGPTVTWRILELGVIRNQIKAANAREQQALAQYEQTVLRALAETENALVNYAHEQQRRQALRDQAAANRKAVDLANQLYAKGNTSFLEVLDAKRSLYRVEDDLAESDRTVVTNLIALYKALGGGWEDFLLP